MPDTSGSLLSALGEGGDAQALMREATEALLQWQLAAVSAPAQAFAEAELQAFAKPDWNEQQQRYWAHSLKVLTDNFAAQPQLALHGDFTPRHLTLHAQGATGATGVFAQGPISYDLASLLRDPFQTWEEEQELDWAIRYWERARKAGLPLTEDFGEFWQQLEWTGLQRHLAMLAQPLAADEAVRLKLLALAIKVSTRYIQLSPLTKLLEEMQAGLVQTGYS